MLNETRMSKDTKEMSHFIGLLLISHYHRLFKKITGQQVLLGKHQSSQKQ